MNALLLESLRRRWPLIGALAVGVIFSIAHLALFQPAARRYEVVLRHAGEMGLAFDPDQAPQSLPPRVFALLADNALPAATAQERGSSGALAATLIEDFTRLAGEHGMEAVSTEPGLVTQLPASVVVRAHLRLRCRYRQFVELLDDLARHGTLYAVDRFTLVPQDADHQMLEMWVSRYVLKQPGGKP